MSTERVVAPARVLHISDLHFGAEDEDKLDCLRELAKARKPDLICVTGDIVEYPRTRFFKAAREFLNQLEQHCDQNVLVVPGNHDALFGAYGLGFYRRYLARPTEFCRRLELRGGLDVCVIGVDSTHRSIGHLNNVGNFTKSRADAFTNRIREAKASWGDARFNRALKIVLLHHHPLPTLSATREGMLYMKNAGAFLRAVTEVKTNLVLHGHQHDPCYYSINYNVGGDENSMVILSAGTASKRLPEEREGFSTKSQVHLISIDRDAMAVECLYYDIDNKEFTVVRRIPKMRSQSKFAGIEERIVYRIAPNGDLGARQRRILRAAKPEGVREIRTSFGVDSRSDPASFAALNFQAYRNNVLLPPDALTVIRDEDHVKTISFRLDPPLGYGLEELSWTYQWPGGWRNLIQDGKDHGYVIRQEERAVLQVEIEADPPVRLRELKVQYFDPARVTYLHTDHPSRRGFIIHNPPLYQFVRYNVWLA